MYIIVFLDRRCGYIGPFSTAESAQSWIAEYLTYPDGTAIEKLSDPMEAA